jgi:hypothetical protein
VVVVVVVVVVGGVVVVVSGIPGLIAGAHINFGVSFASVRAPNWSATGVEAGNGFGHAIL